MFDDIDLRILEMLKEDARVANAAIARDVGLAPSAVFQRIKKLEDAGVIQGYHARIDPDALDQGLLAFISVQTGEGARAKETAELLASVPEVMEVHRVVGDDCFYLKVRVRDTSALGALLDEKIQTLEPVASTNTTIVLSTAKDQDVRLPRPGSASASEDGDSVADAAARRVRVS
ncbi:MAG: Lrp/AsnC family transcriptional regulator [Longimicrobiales bacterium]|nr:Lrp/AsnC family transcriptional regulator [Longimicrobiales bacterium]